MVVGEIIRIKGMEWFENLQIKKRVGLGKKFNREYYENMYIILNSKTKV